MTQEKKSFPTRLVLVLLVISVIGILANCGGGGGVGPSPTPTATPVPTPVARQILSVAFSTRPDIIGFFINFPAGTNGTYTFKARWTPEPPAGQVYLLVVQNQTDLQTCFRDFNCPGMLAKNISDAHPKEIANVRFPAGVSAPFVWTRGITGTTSGFVEVWFTPDS